MVETRTAFGMKKYGQMLMTEDGRDTGRDAVEEMGDLLQYAYKAKMNGCEKTLRDVLWPAIILLIDILFK